MRTGECLCTRNGLRRSGGELWLAMVKKEAITSEEAHAHSKPTFYYTPNSRKSQTADYEDMEILFTSSGTDQEEISLEGVGADAE